MRLEKRDYELKLWKEGFCNEALERAVMKCSSEESDYVNKLRRELVNASTEWLKLKDGICSSVKTLDLFLYSADFLEK